MLANNLASQLYYIHCKVNIVGHSMAKMGLSLDQQIWIEEVSPHV